MKTLLRPLLLLLLLAVAVPLAGCGGDAVGEEEAAEGADAPTGQQRADAIMDRWRRENPGRDWVAVEQEAHTITEHADNSHVLGQGQEPGQTYGRFTEKDLLLWERETTKLVTMGSRIFHSADELGSTVAVSCDMCHPDAANTHPETYPKFQVQMGRAILLRDMINWCIQQPVRGPALDADDPRMRALEAYIYAQRKGVPLIWGKH